MRPVKFRWIACLLRLIRLSSRPFLTAGSETSQHLWWRLRAKSQSFAGQRVLHFVHVPHEFGLAVLNTNCVIQNGSVHVQIHVLVDSNCQDKAAMFAVEGRKIGPAAAEGQTKRSLGDDHVVLSMSSAVTAEETKTTKRLEGDRNFLKAV